MPRSIRLDPELEQRLIDVAQNDGVSVSAAAREAIKEYCDKKKPITLYEALKDYIGAVSSDNQFAGRAHDAFGDLLVEECERKKNRTK
jgi:hypothetical protein